MVSSMVITIRLFGALKKFSSDGMLLLDVPEPCSVQELRKLCDTALSAKYPDTFKSALIERSAFADAARVLGNNEQVIACGPLALLPPVCGG